MSWTIGDEEWLAEPVAVSGAGAIDALDDRVLAAVRAAPPAIGHASGASANGADVPDAGAGGLPPPPHSAAFDEHEERPPSYESGSFVADPVEPQGQAEQIDVSVEPAPLHIPALSSSAQSSGGSWTPAPAVSAPVVSAPVVSAPAVSAPAPAVSAPAPAPAPGGPSSEEAAFVIPNLSRPAAVAEQEPDPELAAAAPELPVEQPFSAADPGGHDQAGGGVPEVLERVDSSELELLADDDEHPSGGEATDPAAFAGFVIPTLARPEPSQPHPQDELSQANVDAVSEAQSAQAPVEAPQPPVVASGLSNVVIPSLTPAVPSQPIATREDEQAEVEGEEVEGEEVEGEEVETLEVESLDSADLEEVGHSAPPAVAAEEAKPPSPPPEAKPQAQPQRRKAWYDDVFAEHFLALFPSTWEETAARDAEFIHSQLGLKDGANVLDVGCGEGSHAIHLAKLGLRATGVDNSLALLLAAAQNKELAGIEDDSVEFMHGDMRRLPRDREFDAVICVGSTFGYFEEEQNRLCLQEMYERLPVGGKLLLHVFNRDFIAPQLPSRSWWQGRRCMVIDEAEMNFFANRLRIHRTIIFDDGRQHEHYMFMRAYTVQDLGKAMSQIGLRVIEVSGSRDTRGRFYGSASPDIWMVAERK